MIKQIEKQVRDLQRELNEMQKKRDTLRLQPCRGDREIHEKELILDNLDRQIEKIKEDIGELEKKRRSLLSISYKGEDFGVFRDGCPGPGEEN
jgi:chromosome segregation ATPase